MRLVGIEGRGEDLNWLNISGAIASWIISNPLSEKKF
jgi:hypothetical protein